MDRPDTRRPPRHSFDGLPREGDERSRGVSSPARVRFSALRSRAAGRGDSGDGPAGGLEGRHERGASGTADLEGRDGSRGRRRLLGGENGRDGGEVRGALDQPVDRVALLDHAVR